LLRWGKALTGLSALAAEIVSFWICISVPFFDLRSAGAAVGFPSREPPPPEVDCCDDDAELEAGAADGSEVMRSISVLPEESCPEAMAAGEEVRGRGRASVRSPATCASRFCYCKTLKGWSRQQYHSESSSRLAPTMTHTKTFVCHGPVVTAVISSMRRFHRLEGNGANFYILSCIVSSPWKVVIRMGVIRVDAAVAS
jgi:hypothetical protein